MIKRCKKAGLREPEFKLTDGFVTTIWRKPLRAFEAVGGEKGQPGTKSAQSQAQVEAQEAQVEAQVKLLDWQMKILNACDNGEKTGKELLMVAGYKQRTGNFKRGLQNLLEEGYIELTIPDKPQSSKQKYRITEKGKELLKSIGK